MSEKNQESKNLKVYVYAGSDIGNYRQENQDNFYINGVYRRKKESQDFYECVEDLDKPQVYAVFDGLGGEEGGEASSRLACDTMESMQEDFIKANPENLKETYIEFATKANEAICKELHSTFYPKGGTTFVSVQISDGVIHPFYLGDSRIYLAFEDEMYLITEDHTVAMEQVRAGEKTLEEALRSPENHMLTHFLGDQPGSKAVDVAECPFLKIAPGMIILMCSDGLHDMVSGLDILEIIKTSKDPARELVEKALANGGFDNVTPVVLRFSE